MQLSRRENGFTLIEVVVAVAVFVIFALGIYSTLALTFKSSYFGRMLVLETAILNEQLEIVRNLPFEKVGTINGIPNGVLAGSQTIARNGQTFAVSTTVRNIDDGADGTATSTPADVAPADYKLVEVSVICPPCNQQQRLHLSTLVAPKGLENASLNGSLFIRVSNAVGQSVPGAAVHIVNASQGLVVDDITDNNGLLKIIDAPTGTKSYDVYVSKAGFSSDYTSAPTTSNPNPTKLPLSVLSQTITGANFLIDQAGSLLIKSSDSACLPLGNKLITLRGAKLIGVQPDVPKYQAQVATDQSGERLLTNLEWDTYTLGELENSYDLEGTIPINPFNILPGAYQEATAVLTPHTANSLLVRVKDSGTGLAMSGAVVSLTKNQSYQRILPTGLGFMLQTDWSGGTGQATAQDMLRYWSDDGSLDTANFPGEGRLKSIGNNFVTAGFLESSTFDLGQAVDFKDISALPASQPTSTGSAAVILQFATSNSSTPSAWVFAGPDGTSNSFFTATNTVINSLQSPRRYARYRLYLATDDALVTPQVSDVGFSFTTNCTPPGQAFFGGLNAGTYNLAVGHVGYASSTATVEVAGNGEVLVNLSPL